MVNHKLRKIINSATGANELQKDGIDAEEDTKKSSTFLYRTLLCRSMQIKEVKVC